MSEETALQAAIIAEPDEDLPRLAYADWLDENKPDERPSPAEGSSARAEFIRVQCRLAAGSLDDPDYPELLERETDLAEWLNVHAREPDSDRGTLYSRNTFDGGEWGNCRRGFKEMVDFEGYILGTAEEAVEAIVGVLEEGFARSTARTLKLEDAKTDEIALLARHPIFERIRGLYLDGLDDSSEDEAIAAIAGSRWATGLTRLYIVRFSLDDASCAALARSPSLRNLESLTINEPISATSIRAFGQSKWFRKLRRLHLWLENPDGLRALADLPTMPRLISLILNGSESTTAAAVRRFATSRAFPALAHLELNQTHLSADQIVLLARGHWPLRHLRLFQNEVRKTGVEALVNAAFAPTLRVLDLPRCEITAAGIHELANSEALAGLRHLNLSENPIGPGGLAALAESKTLAGLRSLDLRRTNTPRGPIAARDALRFLTNLNVPNLRHLALSRVPIGIRGARLLATAPGFANLTRLSLQACAVGEAGTKELVQSKTLTKLVALDLSENKTNSGAGKLLNPNVLPRMASCSLGAGIPKATATRLGRRPGIIIPG
jgi:uncharacterized protein (TIGR02996 family)